MSAREAALLTLVAMERQKAWSNGHLKKVIQEQRLDRRDAALATRLCFGVIQNRMLLDHYLQQYSAMKLSKMESKVRNNLRLGLYQMLFMTKIPVSAAVSEGVKLTKKHCKNPRAGHSPQSGPPSGRASHPGPGESCCISLPAVQPPPVVGGGMEPAVGSGGAGRTAPLGQQ